MCTTAPYWCAVLGGGVDKGRVVMRKVVARAPRAHSQKRIAMDL